MKKLRTPNSVHRTLSVVLATRNEEANIGPCLESVMKIADEIIVVDEESTDKTREIAKKYSAKVYKVKHKPIFHATKQKALDKATGDWILQLDADERVTKDLAKEIKSVINIKNSDWLTRRPVNPKLVKLFQRHQRLIEQRDGRIGKDTGKIAAFFIPRKNYFLGKPLIYAGLFPDASIRLVKKGKARFPTKSVHEQMEVKGEVAWLFNDLEHHDSPTLKRYLSRMNRYTDLHSKELQRANTPKSLYYFYLYTVHRPLFTFLSLYIRHKGFLDGKRGFIWSLFSALHYPLAYFKYWSGLKKD